MTVLWGFMGYELLLAALVLRQHFFFRGPDAFFIQPLVSLFLYPDAGNWYFQRIAGWATVKVYYFIQGMGGGIDPYGMG